MKWLKKKENNQPKQPASWPSGYFEKDIDSDEWKKVTQEKLQYAIDEARLMMGKISDNSNRLISKGFNLLTITIGLVGGIFGLFATNPDYFVHHWWFLLPLALYFICLLVMSYKLFICIQPTDDLSPVGTPPILLLNVDAMRSEFKNMMIKQLENYQGRIDNNIQYNNRLARQIEPCIKWFVGCPLFLLIFYFLPFAVAYYFIF